MTILCENQNVEISGINTLICDMLIRISNIRPTESTIDVQLDNTYINPQVSTVGNSFEYNNKQITIKLISKSSSSANISIKVEDLQPTEYTDTIKVYIKPWGWYTPNQAADKIVLKITDIMGGLLNYLSTISNYSYIKTDVLVEGNYVTLNIRLKQLNIASLEPVEIGLGTIVAILLVTIIVTFGLIVYADWIKEDTSNKKDSYQANPNEQLPGTKTANDDAQLNCLTGIPETPTCDQLKTYATCLDSVHIGIYGTLKSEFPNSEAVKEQYDKHLQKYTLLMADCDPTIQGKTPTDKKSKIITEQEKYTTDLENTFEKLQKDYEANLCWIKIPFTDRCLISQNSERIVQLSIALVGAYYLYSSYRKSKKK
jgi:hypothetical protein